MPKKRVFNSFDYDNDRNYRYLLKALAKNSGSDIEFSDVTPEEIQSESIDRIKSVLTRRIRDATHTLVIIGKHANSYHPDRGDIGSRNWQWWEIEKSDSENRGFIAVKIDSGNTPPEPLKGRGAKWAGSFTIDSIVKAINDA